jgi:riboflavin transporter FmnP
VGTVSHLYTFALYLPLNFFLLFDPNELVPELIVGYFLATIVMSFFSILMYIWVAVPLYLGIGYLVKSIEESMIFDEYSVDAPSLDGGITADRVYRNDDLDF